MQGAALIDVAVERLVVSRLFRRLELLPFTTSVEGDVADDLVVIFVLCILGSSLIDCTPEVRVCLLGSGGDVLLAKSIFASALVLNIPAMYSFLLLLELVWPFNLLISNENSFKRVYLFHVNLPLASPDTSFQGERKGLSMSI